MFHLPKSTPALLLEQHFYADSLQIMYSRSYKKPGEIRFNFELRKNKVGKHSTQSSIIDGVVRTKEKIHA